MAPLLPNLMAYAAQVLCVALLGGLTVALLRVDAPRVRHAFWRALLLVCLVLPWVQDWRPPSPVTTSASAPEIRSTRLSPAAPSSSSASASTAPADIAMVVASVLGAGAAARLFWILLAMRRLAQLRRAGVSARLSEDEQMWRDAICPDAEVRTAPGIAGPATFGLHRPVVLLPDTLAAQGPAIRCAVLCHELFHARRRDWGWLLLEECVRAALWWHPAVWWLVSQVQQSREEVVDRDVIRITGARRPYIEALLAFADGGTPAAAPAFGHPRHLFRRIQLAAKEGVMSRTRLVLSCTGLAITMAVTTWFASSAFPLYAAPAAPDVRAQAAAPADAHFEEGAGLEVDVRRRDADLWTAARTATLRQDGSGAATTTETAQLDAARTDLERAVARARRADAERQAADTAELEARLQQARAALEQALGRLRRSAAELQAAGGELPQAELEQLARRAAETAATLQGLESQRALESAARATEARDQSLESLRARTLEERLKTLETVRSRAALVRAAEARRSAERALARRDAQDATAGTNRARPIERPDGTPGGGAPGVVEPPQSVAAQGGPIRVGGNIRAPRKVRDVKPAYPPEAEQAGIQGIVIIEILIDAEGRVAEAKVLRSIPALDGAALDAVKQWLYEPTLLNGQPVSIIMSVTVAFTLTPPAK